MNINPTTNGENKLPAVDVLAKHKRENELLLLEERLEDMTHELERKRYYHKKWCEAGI